MGPPTRASESFASDFRTFLQADANKALLREAIAGPLMETVGRLEAAIETMKQVITEKDATISQLTDQLKEKDEAITDLKKELAGVHVRCEELEQYSRRNSVRVQGIPEEDREDAIHKALELANGKLNLNPPLLSSDIDRAHRVGSPRTDGRPRSLLIKFATYQQRFRLMKNRYLLKNTPVFINEDLTRYRSKLLYEARALKRAGKINELWTFDGRIHVKIGDDRHHITCYQDLRDLNLLAPAQG